jgi:predicted Zn-dependent protease
VNANAFPGGRIYVWKGLLKALNRDENEVAWVMSHETAHVARRHVTHELERQLGYGALIQLVFRQSNARQIANLVGNLVMLNYGRDREYEADQWGLTYAHDAGFDPTASVAVIKTFQKISGSEASKVEILFGTHPGNNDRLNAIVSTLRQRGWRGKYWQP